MEKTMDADGDHLDEQSNVESVQAFEIQMRAIVSDYLRQALPQCPNCGMKFSDIPAMPNGYEQPEIPTTERIESAVETNGSEMEPRQSKIGRKAYAHHPGYPGEVAHLARMKELRDQGLAYHEIAAVLNLEGVPTRGRGGVWFGAVVSRILHAQNTEGTSNPTT